MITRLLLAALAFAMLPLSQAAAQNWNNEVVETERGYRLGNPDAPVQLIAFVSYTCPVCKTFEIESDAAMRAHYIHEGLVAIEFRPEIHSPVDTAATLAVQCGGADRFIANHRAMYRAQDDWRAVAQGTTEAQRARWFTGSQSQRMGAIASDLDFYDLMELRGYSYGEITRCLGDVSASVKILGDEAANHRDYPIPGTPSFVVNGTLIPDVHSWATLQPVLDAAIAAETAGQ